MDKSNIIITGITGQDGSYMAKYLLENTNHNIIGAARRTSQPILKNIQEILDNPRFKLIHLDLNDANSITSAIKTEKPDFFINFGACAFVADSWNQPALTFQTNSVSLIHILEAIRNHAPECRVYSSGSSEIFGDTKDVPQNESTCPSPCSIYGISKLAAGMVSKVYRESYGLYVVNGILFNHESSVRQSCYLTRKVTMGLGKIVNSLKNNKPLESIKLGNIYAKRDWSHAKDFVRGIWMMLNQKKPKEYVLASGETHTVKEFIEKAAQYSGINGYWVGEGTNEKFCFDYDNYYKQIPIVEIDKEFFRPNEVNLLLGDASLAQNELGWEPEISFDELVAEMVRNDIKLAQSS